MPEDVPRESLAQRWRWWQIRRAIAGPSVWGVPVTLFFTFVLLAILTPWIDDRLSRIFDPYPSVNGGSISTVVSIIAGAMITLSGLTFTAIASVMSDGVSNLSVRIVPMLQQDRVLRWSLGVFTATFGYCLITAVSIALGEDSYQPVLATFVVTALAVVAGCCFIALVVRVTHHINPATVLKSVAKAGHEGLVGDVANYRRAAPQMRERRGTPHHTDGESATITVAGDQRSGLQLLAVNTGRLLQFERDWGAQITLLVQVGTAVPEHLPILEVTGAELTSDRRKAALGALAFGESSSPHSGPVGAIRSIVDIALKALSPAVNDPTRAAQAIDRLEDLLVVVSRHTVAVGESSLAAGWGRDWEDYVSLATDEIRQFGTTSVQIQRRLRAMFVVLLELLPEHQHPPLQRRLADLERGVDRWWHSPLDQALAAAADPQGLGTTAPRSTNAG
ncbi:DUF2254 domain-containing protein [Epidermidibacterium keratini]|uniref:DUF2254 domain-containing protein n=1 Tax=Epidermidibacterium keratini TaxID=1891644 RepID=A0A7L4YTM6_9ACTN|nr:DUF2254 family protein [Epidermidibacterium keratini]QHC01877.1 DUF2254 domain-containing protein [Epidermidibacterium keratini]